MLSMQGYEERFAYLQPLSIENKLTESETKELHSLLNKSQNLSWLNEEISKHQIAPNRLLCPWCGQELAKISQEAAFKTGDETILACFERSGRVGVCPNQHCWSLTL